MGKNPWEGFESKGESLRIVCLEGEVAREWQEASWLPRMLRRQRIPWRIGLKISRFPQVFNEVWSLQSPLKLPNLSVSQSHPPTQNTTHHQHRNRPQEPAEQLPEELHHATHPKPESSAYRKNNDAVSDLPMNCQSTPSIQKQLSHWFLIACVQRNFLGMLTAFTSPN
jgi:hypothetical protein